MINEGARLLEEGIAYRASDIDVVYAAGYGFPRYRGGPMFYADTVGLDVICRRILEFQRHARRAVLGARAAAEATRSDGVELRPLAGRTRPPTRRSDDGQRIHSLWRLLVHAVRQVAGYARAPQQPEARRALGGAGAAGEEFPTGADRPRHSGHHQSAAGKLLRPALGHRHDGPAGRHRSDGPAGLRDQRPRAADGRAGSRGAAGRLRACDHRRPLFERRHRLLSRPHGAGRHRA